MYLTIFIRQKKNIKIIPQNIFILDQSYQDNIIMALKALYNSIDYEFWLVSIDRPVDISGYLSNLQILYNETQDIYRRKLIMEDLDKANDFMKDNVTDIEYYILFKAKDNEIIQRRIRELIMGFSNCQINANQVSNEDLRVLLDSFLNGGIKTENKAVFNE